MKLPRFIPVVFFVFNAMLHAAAPVGSKLTSPDQVPEGLAKSDWQSIREAYEAGRHSFQPVAGEEGMWRALNPGQQLLTTFDKRGFVAEPEDKAWQWGLELKSYGLDGQERDISGVPTVQADGQRLAYQWDASLQEWFVNDQRGLEHGYVVAKRPEGSVDSPLAFTLGVRGGLHPAISADTLGVTFQNDSGSTLLTYTGLKAWDADGKVLMSRFEATGDGVRLLVEERGARYPITIDPIVQQAYLKASNTDEQDYFGNSVAVSGDTVVVGAYAEASGSRSINGDATDNSYPTAGAVYVFVKSGSTWSQQAYLKASNTDESDSFGYSVAVSGDTVVVGSPGEASSAQGVNGNIANNSKLNAGAAYVFVRNGVTWSQQAYLKASNTDASDLFGYSVAASGDTVVVGAYGESSSAKGVNGNIADNSAASSGAAYVFVRNGVTWSQQAYLKASNTDANDYFGFSVAMSGDTVVVGAFGEDSSAVGVNSNQTDNSGESSGAAYVFVRNGVTWSQQAYLKASNTNAYDDFGFSVAVSGDTVVIGAGSEASSAKGVNADQTNNSAENAGAAYVFVRYGSSWSQQAYLKASNTDGGDNFGHSVAISGNTVVIGAFGEASSAMGVNGNQTDNSAAYAGATYVFARYGSSWSQQAYFKASNTDTSEFFGVSVAVSGGTVLIGAYGDSSSAVGVNGDQTNNLANNAGAAFVFNIDADIAVAQGAALTDGVSSVEFLSSAIGTSRTLTFIISNPGDADLTNLVVTKDGPNADEFTVSALSGTSVPLGSGMVAFSVTFAPTSAGDKSATIHIASNVTGSKNPFDISLIGKLVFTQEQYNSNYIAGRDEVISNPNPYNLYNETQYNGNYTAGQNNIINNPNTSGLYSEEQIQDINVGTPLIKKNSATGKFILTINVEKSLNLVTTPFTKLPFNAPGVTSTINQNGDLEFQFPSAENAAFYRLQAK